MEDEDNNNEYDQDNNDCEYEDYRDDEYDRIVGAVHHIAQAQGVLFSRKLKLCFILFFCCVCLTPNKVVV